MHGTPSYYVRATALPEGAEVIDLWVVDGRCTFVPQHGAEPLAPPGGFVLTGLVDCHTHLTMNFADHPFPDGSVELVAANLRDHLRTGVLLLRDIGAVGGISHVTAEADALPRVQAAGAFLAPPGRYFGIQLETPPGTLAAAAAAQAQNGVSWVKVIADFPTMSSGLPPRFTESESNYGPDELAAAVSAAHAAGARLAVHATTRESIAFAVAAGVDSIEHGPALDPDLLEQMAARGIAWTPTTIVLDAMRAQSAAWGYDDVVSLFDGFIDGMRTLLPLAQRLDVPILAGTDNHPGGSVYREVARLHELGLDPVTALAAASTTARAFLGHPALTEGAPADLLWFAADPRISPELLARPERILLGGIRIR